MLTSSVNLVLTFNKIFPSTTNFRSNLLNKQRNWKVDANEFLSKVTPGVKQSRLAPYWAEITKLRNGNCTLAQVCEFLDENDVHISIAGLAQYIKRRQHTEGKGGTQEAAIHPVTAPLPQPRSDTSTAGSKNALIEGLNSKNPLRVLSGSRKPGEFNPIPTAKIEFEE